MRYKFEFDRDLKYKEAYEFNGLDEVVEKMSKMTIKSDEIVIVVYYVEYDEFKVYGPVKEPTYFKDEDIDFRFAVFSAPESAQTIRATYNLGLFRKPEALKPVYR